MDERRKREAAGRRGVGRRRGMEGEREWRRYREPRRRFQLKCRHRRIAAVGVGVGVGVARVMCTTWPAHANRTPPPPRLSAFPSSSRRVLFYRRPPSTHIHIPQSPFFTDSFFFYYHPRILLELGEGWSPVSFRRHLDASLGERFLDPLASLLSLFVFAVFILFLLWALFFGFNEGEREREMGFLKFLFFFFGFEEDGSLSFSRLGGKRGFFESGEFMGIWLNLNEFWELKYWWYWE